MKEMLPPGCSKLHQEKLTLRITCILEFSSGVTEVTITEKSPVECHHGNEKITVLQNFYPMTNGFHMTWSMKLNDSISKLTQLNQSSVYLLPNTPTLADLEKPHFDSHSVIFELDPCNGNQKHSQDTEIWFLDRMLHQHFLTDTFTTYYHLLIISQVKQWFNMYKPITYNPNLLLDPSKEFKSKNKILLPKKRGPIQPAGGQKGPSGPPSTSKSSSSPGKWLEMSIPISPQQ
ncbi:unnamed protein product [Nyctereutes procyonoides]|uniref:(raccoon dog) hypothetical protein n=1 Tax=Nyctereutes procyonoides TaxID=34880 RepID=A0A811ZNA0_NYCPR|nr:unnamed protein product [Nyctereutes procyonoides]